MCWWPVSLRLLPLLTQPVLLFVMGARTAFVDRESRTFCVWGPTPAPCHAMLLSCHRALASILPPRPHLVHPPLPLPPLPQIAAFELLESLRGSAVPIIAGDGKVATAVGGVQVAAQLG